jgi:hypothetical protein
MSITPNIVRGLELPDKDSQSFWSGTEEAYDVKPLFVAGSSKSSKSAEKPIEKTAVLDALAKRNQEQAPNAPEATTAGPQSQPGTEAKNAQPASLELRPPEVSASVGQDVRFELAVEGVKSLYGAILTISYDPKVVDFKTATEGPFLKKDGQQTSFLFSNNIKTGTVDLYITRIGDVGNVEGSGILGAIVFQSKAAGQSPVLFKNVKLNNYSREQLKTESRGTKVIVK